MEQKMTKEQKKKEAQIGKFNRNMVVIKKGDLLQEKVEVIINSVGPYIENGFGGAIGKSVVNECGQEIIREAISETKSVYGGDEIKAGKFISTSACKSNNHKFVLHCVAPAFADENSTNILQKLISEILEFCNDNKVESISIPPMGSGILSFPSDVCAKAFFAGCMSFLEDVDCKTTIRKMNICIFEQDKCETFQEEWDKQFEVYKKDFDDGSEVSGEDQSSSEEEVPARAAMKGKKRKAKIE
jgi:O-acetyl-ADP-ribose deacetylase (regulator of RNase III)